MKAKALALLLSGLAAGANAASPQQPLAWQGVGVPNIGTVSFVVTRPSGRASFPTLIIFHGSHGFAAEYLKLARDLARRGILTVAVCWFSGSVGEGRRAVKSIDCPAGTPPMPLADSDQAFATIDSVVGAVRAMPETRDNQIALFGHSRGGGAVRNYILRGGRVQAAIMNSAGYPASADLSRVTASVLILHGTADARADGGSEYTNIRMARQFEASSRAAGKSVEAHYYKGGTHDGLFVNRGQREDEVRRILQFMRRQFR